MRGELCICAYLRRSSTASGPHLSAFTVPTFSRAGFIRGLGPVKTLPCNTICAHDGSLKLGMCEWDKEAS